jgi:hypothetical protein
MYVARRKCRLSSHSHYTLLLLRCSSFGLIPDARKRPIVGSLGSTGFGTDWLWNEGPIAASSDTVLAWVNSASSSSVAANTVTCGPSCLKSVGGGDAVKLFTINKEPVV